MTRAELFFLAQSRDMSCTKESMASESLVENVSETALWVAVYRARESARPDAVFQDPLAALLAGERGHAIADQMPGSRYTAWNLVTRTSIIDRFLQNLIAEGVDTVLNLGAGLDTRPYRLQLPKNLHWIEADFPHMIAYKKAKLSGETPRCELEREALDLSDAVKRQAFLHKVNNQSKCVAVLTEGVLPYLTNQQVSDLAGELNRCMNVKYWIQDWYSNRSMDIVRKKNSKAMEKSPFLFNPPGDWFSFLEERGWKIREKVGMGEEGERIRRNQMLPLFIRFIAKFFPKARKEIHNIGGCGVFQRM